MSEPRGQAGRKRSTEAHGAIIGAALATLREVGYQQLTMEGVAARAGVAKATVYRWWPNKASLAIEAIGGQLGEPLQPTGDTRRDIRAVVARSFDMFGGLVGEVLLLDLDHDVQAGKQLDDLFGPYRAAHASILLSAAARGDLPYDVDVDKVLDLISGTALVRKLGNRSMGHDLVDELTALVLAGPLPRVTSSGP